jgi:Flp pilus assembly protein TadG
MDSDGAFRSSRNRKKAVLRALTGELRRLLLNETGGPMMEFALVMPMLIALLLAITQIALIFLAQQGLETGAEAAGRLIMTGQVQQYAPTVGYNGGNGMTAADFSNAICGKLSGFPRMLPPFLDCSRLYINVTTASTFSAAVTTAPTFQYNSSGQAINALGQTLSSQNNSFNFPVGGLTAGTSTLASGVGAQIVVVQLMYLWPTTNGPMGLNFINQSSGGNRLLCASSVLVTENYQ